MIDSKNVKINPYAYPSIPLFHTQIVSEEELTPKNIATKIEKYLYLKPNTILTKRRHKDLVLARHFYAYFLVTKKNLTANSVGRILERDRSTIIKNLKNFKGWLESDDKFKKMLLDLDKILTPIIKS